MLGNKVSSFLNGPVMRMLSNGCEVTEVFVDKRSFCDGIDITSWEHYDGIIVLTLRRNGLFFLKPPQKYIVPVTLSCSGAMERPLLYIWLNRAGIDKWYTIDEKVIEKRVLNMLIIKKTYAKELED